MPLPMGAFSKRRMIYTISRESRVPTHSCYLPLSPCQEAAVFHSWSERTEERKEEILCYVNKYSTWRGIKKAPKLQSNIYTCEDSGKTSNQAVLLRAPFSSSLFFLLCTLLYVLFCCSCLHRELQLQRKVFYKGTEMEPVAGWLQTQGRPRIFLVEGATPAGLNPLWNPFMFLKTDPTFLGS